MVHLNLRSSLWLRIWLSWWHLCLQNLLIDRIAFWRLNFGHSSFIPTFSILSNLLFLQGFCTRCLLFLLSWLNFHSLTILLELFFLLLQKWSIFFNLEMKPLLYICLIWEFWKSPAHCSVYFIERLSRSFSAAHEIRRVKFQYKGQTNFECSYTTSMVLLLWLFFVKKPAQIAFSVSVVAQLTDNGCRPNLAVSPKYPDYVIDLRLEIVTYVWLEFQCLWFHKFDPLLLNFLGC